ncbi:cell division ATP-binding protein FtsE [Clostridium sp. UBA4548]|uniref:cell division ATP-binding protein FtsE n=1 Tax=Clostridium sp. UBA4548 TaxID=1946361 RepID=UPI0025C35E76|nr:cell division ATP-binding protein FtsE [Clostridium sp. UBA4548]
MIEFKNVTKVYDNNVLALSNLNINIDKGEFVFLVGPSGAGKSTFIKMLLKEVDPTAGEVIIAGTNITKLTHKEVPFYRRKIGVVFQDFRLIPTLNIYENVAFALRVIGASEREIQKKVPSVLAMVGLTKKRNAFPNQLSGGEQQRVSIARSIVNSPSLLIADEPTGNLDPETSLEIMDIISDINRAGTTIVMATHAKDIVDTMKKRVIAIEKGTVARDEERGKYGYEI